MNNSESLFIICLAVMLLLTALLIIIQQKLINRHKDIIVEYQSRLNESSSNNDALLRYCLTHILKLAIDNEDYETAGKCTQLLKEMETVKSN